MGKDEKGEDNYKGVEMITFFWRVVAAPIAATTSEREAIKNTYTDFVRVMLM